MLFSSYTFLFQFLPATVLAFAAARRHSPRAGIMVLVVAAGRRCGFDVLNIQQVPGLEQGNYADEMHVNASGVPIYTRYLVSRLKR